jgi:hypothetical protein
MDDHFYVQVVTQTEVFFGIEYIEQCFHPAVTAYFAQPQSSGQCQLSHFDESYLVVPQFTNRSLNNNKKISSIIGPWDDES